MKIRSKSSVFILFLGDVIAFGLALWLALVVRARQAVEWDVFSSHLVPFLFIFAIWILVFFIADLYRPGTSLFRRKLPTTISNALIANSIIAVLFFYLIPYFGITPKTILFIDLILTFGLVYLWRRFLVRPFSRTRREQVYFACQGPEVDQIISEFSNNPDYNLKVLDASAKEDASVVVINPHNQAQKDELRRMYEMLLRGTRFENVNSLYEELFDRIPLSLINEQWFLENVSNHPKVLYTLGKRTMDIAVALVLAVIPLVLSPIVWILMQLFDRGRPLFSYQTRVGQNGRLVRIIKFRTMTNADDGGKWGAENNNRVTPLGMLLRKWRIDEWPQIWNVFNGDVSFIGPRPEFEEQVKRYEAEVPYYSFRHVVKPGLSGWAQVYHQEHPHHADPESIRKTRDKLSYDLFYVKNRSLWLDIVIALKTVKELLSRQGK